MTTLQLHFITRWIRVLLALTLLFLAGWGINKLFDARVFPIRHVSVAGDYRHLNPLEIRELLVRALHARSFFTFSVQDIGGLLEKTPWIQRAKVRRIWPDTLGVLIEERKIAARWGNDAFLSTEGLVFTPFEKTPLKIKPVFWGDVAQAPTIMRQYFAFSQRLRPLGLKISELSLDLRQSWRVKLENGIAIELGRNEFNKKWDRFIKFYRQYLTERSDTVISIDMRYTNGAAVLWRST